MPNVPLVALAEKVHFLLGNWGFAGQAHSDALAMVFDNFLIEVGLYGSPLYWSHKDYGNLSTESTWFHNLWFTTLRPTSCFAKRTLFRAYGRTIAPSYQIFFVWVTAEKTLSLLTLSNGFVISCTCQTYPNVMAQHWMNLRSWTNWNSLLGACSHKRNQWQQTGFDPSWSTFLRYCNVSKIH